MDFENFEHPNIGELVELQPMEVLGKEFLINDEQWKFLAENQNKIFKVIGIDDDGMAVLNRSIFNDGGNKINFRALKKGPYVSIPEDIFQL